MSDDFEKDDLDEFIEETAREHPDFPEWVEAGVERRILLRQLAQEREKAGMSQTQVAARMNTSQSAVSRLESGETVPKLSTLEAYAIAIGRRFRWSLVDETEADSTAA